MKKYSVDYFYLAQGMDEPDKRDYGTIEANSPEEACHLVASHNSMSKNDYLFLLGCLRAKEVVVDGFLSSSGGDAFETIVNALGLTTEEQQRHAMLAAAPPKPELRLQWGEWISKGPQPEDEEWQCHGEIRMTDNAATRVAASLIMCLSFEDLEHALEEDGEVSTDTWMLDWVPTT